MDALGQVNLNFVTAALVFALVFVLWLIGLIAWVATRSSRMQKVQQRLGVYEDDTPETRVLRLWREGKEITTTVQNQVKPSFMTRLEYLRHEAGWTTPIATVLLIVGGIAAGLFMVTFALTQSVIAALGPAALTPLIAYGVLKSRVDARLAQFESQFVEALELAARSLRAGHPLVGAFQLITREMSPPVSVVFGEICQLQTLGLSIEDAIRRTASASSSPDLKLFATSVVMQVRSGGNLADMMFRLAAVMRDRMRLRRRVRVLTAQMTLSKRVLLLLPFFLLVVMYVMNPQYMALLHGTRPGQMMLVAAGCGLLLGGWVMNRLSSLKY